MDQSNPKICVDYKPNAIIASLTYRKILEASDIQALEDTIMPLIEQNNGLNLIINFATVEFLSSAVLGLLIRVSKRTIEADGTLKLCEINPRIFEVFKITGLNRVFDIYDDQDYALQSLDR